MTYSQQCVLGAIVPNVSGLLDSSSAREMMQRLGGDGGIERSLVSAELSVTSVAVTCFGIAAIGRCAADERAGLTETVQATATSRTRSFIATLLPAILGAAWLLTLTGVAIALGYGIAEGDLAITFRDVVPAAVAQLPAVLVVLGIAGAAYGVRVSYAPAGWIAVASFVTLGQVGELLNLPRWVLQISPFTHSPAMPAAGFALWPEAVLTGVATVLLAFAGWRYAERNIG